MTPLEVGDCIDGTEHDQTQPGREWQTECRRWLSGYTCTRLVGHDGQHESAGLTKIESVWP